MSDSTLQKFQFMSAQALCDVLSAQPAAIPFHELRDLTYAACLTSAQAHVAHDPTLTFETTWYRSDFAARLHHLVHRGDIAQVPLSGEEAATIDCGHSHRWAFAITAAGRTRMVPPSVTPASAL